MLEKQDLLNADLVPKAFLNPQPPSLTAMIKDYRYKTLA